MPGDTHEIYMVLCELSLDIIPETLEVIDTSPDSARGIP
jgi:hypothetical protein